MPTPYERPDHQGLWAGTVRVAVVAVEDGRAPADVSVDHLDGRGDFCPRAVPGAGAAVTAGLCLRQWPVRFDIDQIAVSLAGLRGGAQIPTIPIKEVKAMKTPSAGTG